MKVLGARLLQVSGHDIRCEVVATGNGPALRIPDCPLVPLTLHDTHRLLARFGRAAPGTDEGLTPEGERLAAVLGEIT